MADGGTEDLSFERVQNNPEAGVEPSGPSCTFCRSSLGGEYFEVNGAIACALCAEEARHAFAPKGSRSGRVLRATAGGVAAAVAGALVLSSANCSYNGPHAASSAYRS